MIRNKSLFSFTGLVIAAILLVTVNIISTYAFKSARLDLTENRLYTLSQGTKNILDAIDEPITLRYYFSQKLLVGVPGVANYGRRVRELLEEYAALAGTKLKLTVVDPEPFSDNEDQAVQYGLQGVPVDSAGSLAYFGMVGSNATDDRETIAFFQPEREQSLEYDITRIIYKLSHPKQRVVGVLTTLPMNGGSQQPFMTASAAGAHEWVIMSQLRQQFNVRPLDPSVDKIDDDIDVLLLVHPKSLSDKTLYAIDQFVLAGGRVMVFVDPFSESDTPLRDAQNPMTAATAPRASNPAKLFDAWGVELLPGKIATDRLAATRVSTTGRRMRMVDYVAWLSLKPENFNTNDFATAELHDLTMATPGVLQKKDGGTTEFTPLLTTSNQAMEVPQNRIQFGPDPAGLLRDYQPGGNKLVLAARVSGKVKTAFPGGPPGKEKDKDKGTKATGLTESKDAINVVVVADTDLLSDRFWVDVKNFFGRRMAMPRADNATFVINAIDNLSGNNDLISLRSRGESARPFDKVLALKRDAEQRFRDEERRLRARLDETQRKLNELQRQKQDNNALILSDEQRRELDKFRAQQVQTRKELRNVQHELGKSIEQLGARLKFINIALIPILIVMFAAALGLYRMRRMKVAS